MHFPWNLFSPTVALMHQQAVFTGAIYWNCHIYEKGIFPEALLLWYVILIYANLSKLSLDSCLVFFSIKVWIFCFHTSMTIQHLSISSFCLAGQSVCYLWDSNVICGKLRKIYQTASVKCLVHSFIGIIQISRVQYLPVYAV